MAKSKVDLKVLKEYISKVSEHYKIDGAYLFGSFAKGDAHEHSDIDVAIISKDITNRCLDSGKMMALTRGIDTRIEPHAIRTSEFKNKEIMLVNEILEHGIAIV